MQPFIPQVTVNAADLKRALACAAAPIKRHTKIAVLGTARFVIGEGCIAITGTDLGTECLATCAANIEAPPFSFTLRPAPLAGILRWASGDVSFAMQGDILTIRADDFVAQFRALIPASDYPDFGWHDSDTVRTIPEALLHKALAAVALCISTEKTRHYLNGTLLTDAEGLRCVATDGHRMARYDTHEAWGIPDLILPTRTVRFLLNHTKPGGNRAVQVTHVPNDNGSPRLEFKTDDWRFRSKTIDGTYPNYTRVIPPESDAFSATISAAAISRFPAADVMRAMKIDPDNGSMSVTNMEGTTFTMPVTGHGPAMLFNVDYVKTFARHAGTIRMSGAGGGHAVLVLTEDPNLLQVLMPMRL